MSYKRVLLTPSTIFEPKYRTQLCNFPNFRPKYPKLSILTENWVTWYLGGADSKSGLRFLKLQPQNPFLSKFGPKKSNLSVLSKNWHTCYLKDADPFSKEADSCFGVSFLNFLSKIHFGQIWAKKVKVFHFA